MFKKRLEKAKVENYELNDGLVFRIGSDEFSQLYVSFDMEQNVIRMIHEKICHLGVEKTCNQIRKNYWFPGIRRCIMYSAPVLMNIIYIAFLKVQFLLIPFILIISGLYPALTQNESMFWSL